MLSQTGNLPSVKAVTVGPPLTKESSSYGQILKSSSITGTAQVISLVLGMIRNKLVALLLGPGGVGLIGLYESVLGLMGTLSGLGITSSSVRQIALAYSTGDTQRLAHTAYVTRFLFGATGLLGVLLTAILAASLSKWTFGTTDHAGAISLLALSLLLTSLANGNAALLRGVRRIAELARLQVLTASLSLVISVCLYAWLGVQGIVPAILLAAAFNLALSWNPARRVVPLGVRADWHSAYREMLILIKLGLSFVVGTLSILVAAWLIRRWIFQGYGLHGNGIYHAAWTITGAFVGFVLSAMGMDFYPRLAAVAGDNQRINRLVNEQTEIGILLALPGLLAAILCSPWIIRLLYSIQFNDGAQLLPWFIVGALGRVVSWPLGFVQLAKAAAAWFAATELLFNLVLLLLTWLFLRWYGLVGVALVYPIAYVGYTILMLMVTRHLTQFVWSRSVTQLVIQAIFLTCLTLALGLLGTDLLKLLLGVPLVITTALICLRCICQRLEREHPLKLWAGRFL